MDSGQSSASAKQSGAIATNATSIPASSTPSGLAAVASSTYRAMVAPGVLTGTPPPAAPVSGLLPRSVSTRGCQ